MIGVLLTCLSARAARSIHLCRENKNGPLRPWAQRAYVLGHTFPKLRSLGDLPADFARFVRLCMHVNVPASGHEIRGLQVRKRGVALDRAGRLLSDQQGDS